MHRDEADVEHASAKELMTQLEQMEPSDDQHDAKVTVLGEYDDHHVKEEEGGSCSRAKTHFSASACADAGRTS